MDSAHVILCVHTRNRHWTTQLHVRDPGGDLPSFTFAQQMKFSNSLTAIVDQRILMLIRLFTKYKLSHLFYFRRFYVHMKSSFPERVKRHSKEMGFK